MEKKKEKWPVTFVIDSNRVTLTIPLCYEIYLSRGALPFIVTCVN